MHAFIVLESVRRSALPLAWEYGMPIAGGNISEALPKRGGKIKYVLSCCNYFGFKILGFGIIFLIGFYGLFSYNGAGDWIISLSH